MLWFVVAAAAAMLLGLGVLDRAIRRLWRCPVRSFAAASEPVGTTTPVSLGLRPVPVARVVGSVGRWRELATDFRPRRPRWDKIDDERYRRIETALRRGHPLPPIVAYLLEGEYYVLDGHHRVAAAKALGQVFIDAEVTEYRRAPRLAPLRCAANRPMEAVACCQECLAA